MSSGREAEAAQASLAGHKRDRDAVTVPDEHSSPHGDGDGATAGAADKRARVDGDNAASASRASGAGSNASGVIVPAPAAGSFSRLAAVEVESVLQLLDLRSLLRVAATCRALAADALRPASGKFITDDGQGISHIVIAEPEVFKRNLQRQRQQRQQKEGAADSAAAAVIAAADPPTLALDLLTEQERCPVLCAHLPASFAPARTTTWPQVHHHDSSAGLSDQLLLRARRIGQAQDGSRSGHGVCELDLKGCELWSLADATRLLAEPWLQSVSSVRLPLSGVWMLPQVQMALFALPRLAALTVDCRGDGRLLDAALRQAKSLRALKLAYPACETRQLRALSQLPGPLTSLSFDATPLQTGSSGRGRNRGLGPDDDLSDNVHRTPCFPLLGRLSRLPAQWGLGALEDLDLHQLDLKHARSATVRNFFAALPRLRRVRAQQAEIDVLLNGLSRLPRNKATAAAAEGAAAAAAASCSASPSSVQSLPLLRDVHWLHTMYKDERVGCGGVTAEPVLRRFCHRFPLVTVRLDENRGEAGLDHAEYMRRRFKLWAPQVDTLWREATREYRRQCREAALTDAEEERDDVCDPLPRPLHTDSDDQDGLPYSDAEQREDDWMEELEDEEEEQEVEEEGKEADEEETAAAPVGVV